MGTVKSGNTKYHIGATGNAKGKVVVCRAQQKCRLKTSSPHFSSREEGEQWLAKQAEQEHDEFSSITKKNDTDSTNSNPLDILPTSHRDQYKDSDAFYNTTGTVDREAIDILATYYYYKELVRSKEYDDDNSRSLDEARYILAKKKFLNTEYGSDYNGWQYDNSGVVVDREYTPVEELEKRGVVSYQKMPEYNEKWSNDAQFQPSHEKRVSNPDHDNEVKKYAYTSREYLKTLTPQEHNAISYWTSCGATVVNSIEHKTKNVWDIHSDPKGDSGTYFDYNHYMKTLDTALDKAQLPGETILYRGASKGSVDPEVCDESYEYMNRPRTREWLEKNFVKGQSITFKTPQSATSDNRVALRFSHSTSIIYEIKAHKAAAVGTTSAWGFSEREYLMPRTTKYKVVDVMENVTYSRYSRVYEKDINHQVVVIQLEQQ